VITLIAAMISGVTGALAVARRVYRLTPRGQAYGWRQILPVFLILRLNFFVVTGAGIWILGMYRTPEEVAIYGAASMLGLIVQAPFIAINGVVAPVVAQLHSERRLAALERVVRGARP
jgi:O-antigen/teichoic acid export membrane protein